MVDHPSVCCMCGDVGFPEKLFHCTKCRSRFQHSYTSSPSPFSFAPFHHIYHDSVYISIIFQSHYSEFLGIAPTTTTNHWRSPSATGAGARREAQGMWSLRKDLQESVRESWSGLSTRGRKLKKMVWMIQRRAATAWESLPHQGLLGAGTSCSRMSCVRRRRGGCGDYYAYVQKGGEKSMYTQ